MWYNKANLTNHTEDIMNCKSCGDEIERKTEGEELCPMCWAFGEQFDHEQHELTKIYHTEEEADTWR